MPGPAGPIRREICKSIRDVVDTVFCLVEGG